MVFKRTSFKNHSTFLLCESESIFTQKQETNCTDRMGVQRQRQSIKSSITALCHIPLHIGDATSMSKVSESMEEIQIQAINIRWSSIMCVCLCIRPW